MKALLNKNDNTYIYYIFKEKSNYLISFNKPQGADYFLPSFATLEKGEFLLIFGGEKERTKYEWLAPITRFIAMFGIDKLKIKSKPVE